MIGDTELARKRGEIGMDASHVACFVPYTRFE
jgi:hypothetical protein